MNQPQMNQHPCKISTLASFTDILKQQDSENFSPVRNINCATMYRSISAQRDFRLGALSRIEQGSFYSIGRPRATVETYIAGEDREFLGRRRRGKRPFGTKDLLFSTYELASASRLARTRFSRMVGYVTV